MIFFALGLRRGGLFVLLLAVCARSAWSQELDPRLVNYDISGQIRFQNSVEAEQRRDQLIRAIWKSGLPKTRPVVTEKLDACEELAAVKPGLISRIDRYTCDVSGMDFQALVYVANPKTQKPGHSRLAIVQGGHMREGKEHYLDSGLATSAERLLEQGFVVALVQMPLVGWNHDASGKLPDGTPFEIKKRGSAGHDEMFQKVEPVIGGQTMAFFLEPVVQATNELLFRHPDSKGVLMIGLSGGGWTTHCSAALDPRILYSVPVAGALPLYARPFSRGSKGDAEQEYAPIFREEDSNQDGVLDKAAGICSWLEVFALGGLGTSSKSPRKQVQVINLDDSCCFNGPVYKTYNEQLAERVSGIGTGEWQVYVDASHKDHMISDPTLNDVLMPLITRLENHP